MTIDENKAAFLTAEKAIIKQAIIDGDGSLARVLVLLGVKMGHFYKLLDRHGLGRFYFSRSSGPGRPKKVKSND